MALESDKLISQTLQHLGLTFLSLLLATAVGVPLGIFIARRRRYSGPVLGAAGVLQTIPSIALLGFMIPLLGIGATPAVVALLLYALLPIIRNTYTGITGVDRYVIEAARAMGMTPLQILAHVELPLSMPVLLAGIRTATVICVGVATLGSLVAAGGLGEFIFGGISLNNTNMILAGALPAALLAIALDILLWYIQRMPSKHIKRAAFLLTGFLTLYLAAFFWPKTHTSTLSAGFTPEFMGRPDGDLGLKSVYHLQIPTTVLSDAIMYEAVREKEIDVISGYSTDGRVKAYGLYVLDDDRQIFPPYYAAPIVSLKALQRFPGLEQALDLLAGKINDSVMASLNYKTDFLHKSPTEVAAEFLKSKGLYKPPGSGSGKTVRIGSKIFGEQYILAEMYSMLIRGNTDYRVDTKTGLGGTKICFDALVYDRIDLYPEYTGTGLLAILKADHDTAAALSKNKDETYNYVKEQFLRKFGIRWLKPIGFNNAYALMMREEQAKKMGIKTISQLKLHLDQDQSKP